MNDWAAMHEGGPCCAFVLLLFPWALYPSLGGPLFVGGYHLVFEVPCRAGADELICLSLEMLRSFEFDGVIALKRRSGSRRGTWPHL